VRVLAWLTRQIHSLHRGRIFLRLALNEGSACLCSYIQALTWNKKLTQYVLHSGARARAAMRAMLTPPCSFLFVVVVRKYYAENALFRSDELLNALLDILHKADDITFCLWYKEPELKKRSYYRKRLLLSGCVYSTCKLYTVALSSLLADTHTVTFVQSRKYARSAAGRIGSHVA